MDDRRRAKNLDELPFVFDLSNHEAGEEIVGTLHVGQRDFLVHPALGWMIPDVATHAGNLGLVLNLGADEKVPVVPVERKPWVGARR